MAPSNTDQQSAHPPAEESALRPTYAPIAMAMGIAMTTWGLVSLSLNINALAYMSLAGAGLMIWALRSWIGEIVHQWES